MWSRVRGSVSVGISVRFRVSVRGEGTYKFLVQGLVGGCGVELALELALGLVLGLGLRVEGTYKCLIQGLVGGCGVVRRQKLQNGVEGRSHGLVCNINACMRVHIYIHAYTHIHRHACMHAYIHMHQ